MGCHRKIKMYIQVLLIGDIQSAPDSRHADTLASEDPEPMARGYRKSSYRLLYICRSKNELYEMTDSRGLPAANHCGM
jgi:hypothetical protein